MKRPLIAYYSFSGNTWMLAEEIAAQISGELLEIVPEDSYAFNYNTAAKEVRAEITRGFCPKLKLGGESIDAYDTIFVGTPNWFKGIAPPVLTFLRTHDFSGKTVIPFCSHGGGGFGEIEQCIAKECPGANILPGFAAESDISTEEIAAWLGKIGLL